MNDQLTLRERITDALRKSIISGELKPGARLQEVEIAAVYETSRTPVREAFRQLESEGLLQIKARRGAVVSPISSVDIDELFEIRSVLEAYAATKVIESITADQVLELQNISEKVESCLNSGNIEEFLDAQQEFMSILISSAGNSKLHSLLENMSAQSRRYATSYADINNISSESLCYRGIVSAIRSGDSDKVLELMKKQAEANRSIVVDQLKAA